jgi:hypothetical protein
MLAKELVAPRGMDHPRRRRAVEVRGHDLRRAPVEGEGRAVINLPEWSSLTSESGEISAIVTDDRERPAQPLTSNDAHRTAALNT